VTAAGGARARLRIPAAPVLLIALALATPRGAHAWGDEGHEIIALIAAHDLTPAARAHVAALLATDRSGLTRGTGIAVMSTWADRYRDSDRHSRGPRYRRTRRWHYADIELDHPDPAAACRGEPAPPAGVPASRGPADDCVIDKVREFDRELAAPATSRTERLRALQFLLHLVGDLHQPLHCSDDHDRGGNRERVAVDGHPITSLHGAWDTLFVRDLGPSPGRVAAALIGDISPADRRRWRRGTPRDWAMQSFDVAARIAYGRLPPPGPDGVIRLGPAYLAAASAAVRGQLERAGVRLAALLNADLR
jgi:nuclease S1